MHIYGHPGGRAQTFRPELMDTPAFVYTHIHVRPEAHVHRHHCPGFWALVYLCTWAQTPRPRPMGIAVIMAHTGPCAGLHMYQHPGPAPCVCLFPHTCTCMGTQDIHAQTLDTQSWANRLPISLHSHTVMYVPPGVHVCTQT